MLNMSHRLHIAEMLKGQREKHREARKHTHHLTSTMMI